MVVHGTYFTAGSARIRLGAEQEVEPEYERTLDREFARANVCNGTPAHVFFQEPQRLRVPAHRG